MDHDNGATIGERLKQLRANRLTQRELAEAADVSLSLIQKLEQGQRHTVSMPSLHALAWALDVDAGELLAPVPTTTRPTPIATGARHPTGAVALRRALTHVNDLIGDEPDVEPLTVEAGRRAVRYGWTAYWAGRTHDQLPQMLPAAIAQARAGLREATTADRAAAAEVAAELYQIAGCTLVQLGYPDSAHLALREALTLATHGHDELRPMVLRGSLAWLLLNQGRFTESHKVATAAAAAIAPSGTSPLPAWSAYGSLLLSGATAAARDKDRPMAGVLLDEAREAAAQTGNRDDYELAFGPDQVTMQAMDVEVVSERYSEALDVAKAMPVQAALPLAARARHMSDQALAYTRLGRDDQALRTLMRIKATAPQWLAGQRQPRQIVRELRTRAANRQQLVELARHVGILHHSEP